MSQSPTVESTAELSPPVLSGVESSPGQRVAAETVAPGSLRGLDLLEQAEASLAAEIAASAAASASTPASPTAPPLNAAGLRMLSILMPVYNERWTVADVIRRVAATPLDIAREIVVIDDGSTDGSADEVERLMDEVPNLSLVRLPRNGGKGAAIRQGIEAMRGDVAVIQDADLEYDPADLPRLLRPILDGRADAVFGSRFAGTERRCLPFWHAKINAALTLVSNMVTGTSLTDMETGYKVIRADILRSLRLRSRSFTIEPELTCRLAQWGARIYELPIAYRGRSMEEGKKIRPRDGIKAILTLLRCRILDTQYSDHPEDALLRSLRHARHFNRSLVDLVEPHLGERVLDIGAGTGNLSGMLLRRPRVVLVDHDRYRVSRLEARFSGRGNTRIEQADITDRDMVEAMRPERLDTILAIHCLQQIGPDFLALRNAWKMLEPGGRLVAVVPLGADRLGPMDAAMGNLRRYDLRHLVNLMERAGFEVVETRSFNRLGSIGAALNRIAGRWRIGSLQVMAFDRLWWLLRGVDRWLPAPPLSALVVARKPAE